MERSYEVHIYLGGQFVESVNVMAGSYEEACHKGMDVHTEVLDRDRVADEDDEDD